MDAQLSDWKHAVERLWSAPSLAFREAALLMAEIARQSQDPVLQHAAAQALPSFRGACVKGADQRSKDVARRRLGVVRDALHVLTGPRFGKRGSVRGPTTPDERYRQMLGLPSGRRLFGPEIQQAYKRVAKKVHPDVGGSEQAFRELSAARDALLKSL